VPALSPLYYVLYALSAFVFVIGLFMYIFPSVSILRRVTGTLLFSCGLFLLTNSDLIVTAARLAMQVSRFRASNKRFGESVQEQAIELQRLRKAEHALREVGTKFGGDVGQAVKEVARLEDVCRSDVARCTKNVCRLYCDVDQDQLISSGAELNGTFELMGSIFGGAVKDYPERVHGLKEALLSKASVRRDGGIQRRTFEEIMECALSEPDPKRIPQVARRVLDGAPKSTVAIGGG